MKLTIGDNIRAFRRAIDMTQEELAKQLDVSYQSVSRWENGSCYPDMELLPAMARIFSTTTDALLGCKDDEKWKRFDGFIKKFESMVSEPDKNAETIVSLMREARRDYPEYINMGPICHYQTIFSQTEYHRLYENPIIRDEITILANFITEHSNNTLLKSFVIKSMSKMISDENLDVYLNKNATNDDLSKSTLLRERYKYRLNW